MQEALEKRDTNLQCQGKKVNEVGDKQKGRKIRLLKNRAQCELWLSRSFCLELSQIKLHDKHGCSYSLDYDDCTQASDLTIKMTRKIWKQSCSSWTNFVLGMSLRRTVDTINLQFTLILSHQTIADRFKQDLPH